MNPNMVTTEKISTLAIKQFRLMVKLGCEPGERELPQAVDIDVVLSFEKPPIGCETDRLDQTVCYGDICEALSKTVEGREFKLIENLGYRFYMALQELSFGEKMG